MELAEAVISIWEDYGRTILRKVPGQKTMRLTLITGGWSENEYIVAAIENSQFSFLFWKSSDRGGLHIYEFPIV